MCMAKIAVRHDRSFPGEAPPRAGQQSSKGTEPGSQPNMGGEGKNEQLHRSSQDSAGQKRQQRLWHFVEILDTGAGWPHPS